MYLHVSTYKIIISKIAILEFPFQYIGFQEIRFFGFGLYFVDAVKLLEHNKVYIESMDYIYTQIHETGLKICVYMFFNPKK